MAGPNLNPIITPMLDMAFQLMAFFIMTYHPSALEGHIDGKLSLPPGGGPPKIDKPANADPDPELADMIRVAVRANPDGSLQRLELIRPEDAGRASIIEAGDALGQGLVQLKKELNTLRKNTAQIRLEGDPGLRHQHVMRVYDVCRLAGFDKIHFEAPK